MDDTRALITRFYDSFASGDAASMAACYTEDAEFHDPVFGTLRGDDIGVMWRLLCELANGTLKLTYDQVNADQNHGSAHWTAIYVFSATGRPVTNNVATIMTFRDGKIFRHVDSYSFAQWARQALGPAGYVLGSIPLGERIFQSRTRKLLQDYKRKHA